MPLFDFGANPLFETAQAGRLAKYAASGNGYKPAAPTEPEQSDAPVESGDPGVLRKIGSTAISGVGAAGNLLDLPGSSVRDLISGRNPFDQWLDPFGRNADKNRVEGRQLLRESGMIGKKNTWGNFAGGLALEMVLDPTTYLGIPAASKIGKAFEVAGLGNKQLKAVVKEIAEDTGAKGFKSGRSWGMNTTGKRILDHMAKSRDTIASAVAKERKMKLIKEPFSSLDSLPKTADDNALALLDEGGAYSLYKYSPNKKDGAGWIVDDDATELFRGKMGTRALGDKTYNGVKAVTEGYYKKKYKDGYDEALMSQPLTSFVSFKAPFMESTRKDLWYDKTPDISFEKRMGKQGVDLDGTMGGATPPPPKPPRSPKPKGGPDAQGAGPAGTPPTTPPGGTPNLPQVPGGAATSAAGKVGLQLSEDIKRQLKEAQLSDEDIAGFETMDEVNDFLYPDAGNGIPVGDFPKDSDTLPPTTGTSPTPQTPPPGPSGGGGTPGASANAPDLNVTSAAAEQVSDVTKPSTGVKSEAGAAGGDVAKDAGKVPTFEDVATTLKVVDGTARGKRIKELFGIRGAQESLVNIPIIDAAMKTLAKGVKGGEDALWERISFREFDDQKELQKVIKDAGGVEKLFQSAATVADDVDAVAGASKSQRESATKEWRAKGVASSFFKRWFGDWEKSPAQASKVVDLDGKPLVVYHGTDQDFDVFKNPYAEDMSGEWSMFATEPAYSGKFAEGRGGNIKPVYLDIKKPFDLSHLPARRGDVRNKLLDTFRRAGLDVEALNKVLPHEYNLHQFINRKGFREHLAKALKEKGYDGIKMPDAVLNVVDNAPTHIESTTYIPFNKNQIKSATGNTGEFSSESTSILHQKTRQQANARGMILTQNSKSLVALFAGKSDASTVMHEFAHFARRYLPSEMSARAAAGVKKLINDTIASAVAKERKMKLIKKPFSSLDSLPKTADENALALLDEGGSYSLYKYSPNKKDGAGWIVDDDATELFRKNILDENGAWTEEAEEAFARAWERYLREGESPTKSLRNVFRAMKSLMQQVYKGFLKNELEINPELKVVFDELLGKQPKVPKAKKAAVDAQGVAGAAAAAGGVLDNVVDDAAKAVDNVAPVDDVTKTMVEDLPPDVNATSSVDDVTNTADDVVDETQKVETPPPSASETLVNKSKAVSDDATTNQAGKPVSDDPMRAAVDTLGDGDAIKELIYKALQTPNKASLKALGITGRAATDVLRLLDKPLKDKTAESLAEAAEIISLRHTLSDAPPAVLDVKPKGLAGDSVSPIEDAAKTADNVVDDATKAADETVDDVTKVETPPPSAAEELVNKSKAVSDDAATAENALIKEGTQAAGELAEQTPDNPLITIANKELDDAVDAHVSAAAAELIDDMKNGIATPGKPDALLSSMADKIIRRIHEEVPNLDVNNVDNTHIINRIKGTQEGITQQVRNAAQDVVEEGKRETKNANERAKRAEAKAAAGKEADVKEAPEVLSDAQIQENRKLGETKWKENEDAIVSAAMRAAQSASRTATNHHDNILSKIMKEAYNAILKDPEEFDIKKVGGWMYKRATQRMLSELAENAKKIRSSEGEIVGGLSRNYQSTPLSTSMHLDELMQGAGIVGEADMQAVRSMFLESKATKEAAKDAGMTTTNAATLRRKFSSYIRKQYSGMQESDVDGVLINSAGDRVKSATTMQRQAIDEVADSVTNDFIKHDMYKQAYEQKKSVTGKVSITDQIALKKEMDAASTSTPKAFMIRSVLKRILQNFTEKEAILDVVKKSEDNVIRQEFERLFPGEKMPDKVDEISEYMEQFRTFTNENSAVNAKVDDTIHSLFQRRNKKAAKKINDEGKDFVSKINSGAKQQPNTTQAARAAVNSIDDYQLKLQMMDAMDGGEHLFFSNPIIRRAATLFDRTVLGGHTEQGQELARKQTEAWIRATFVFRRQLTGLVRAIGKTKLFSEHEIMKEYAELGADAAREKAREILNQRHNEFLRYMERDTHTLNTDLFKNTAHRELLSGQLDLLKDVMPQELRRDALAGMETPDVNDEFINYWARYWYKGHTKTAKKARGEKVVEVGAEHHKARAKHTKNLPGGTATLNEISLDRNISGKYWEQDTLGIGFKDLIDNNGKKMKAYDYIREKYGVNIFGDRDFKMKDGARVVDKAEKEVLNATGRRKLKGITEMALHMPPVHAQKQIPMYGNNFIHDFAKRVEEGYARRGVALAAQEMAARNAGKGKQVGIEQFMKDIKTDNAQAFKNVISGSGNMDEYMKFLDKKIASLDKVLANKGYKTKNGLLKEIDGKIYRVTDEGEELIAGDKVDVLENILNIPKEFAGDEKGIKLTVDHEVYEEAMRFLKPWSRPQEVGDFMKIMHSTLNWFKTHVTIPFLSFHGRNFISGQIMNYFYDAYDPTAFGLNRYAKPIKQAFMLRGGHVVKGLYSEMPEWVQKDIKRQYNTISNVDEAASRWVQDNVFTYGLTGDKQGYAAERMDASASSTITQMPGASPPNGFMGLLNRAAPGTRWFDRVNPFHIRGGGKPVLVPKVPSAAGGLAAKANPTDQKRWKTVYDKVFGEREWDKYDETAFMPVAIGEDMAVLTEDVNRIAPFMAFVKQGMDPAVAARKVQNIHFDYSDLSEFEKGLRNVFPFMTFTRKVIPLTFHDLATNPGGKQAWAIRASTRAQDPALSAPDNVLRSTAIPLGQTESGADQYITGFGLPYEDALSFTGFLQGDWQGTVGELVSRMRPEIQGAAELATGQSTFFGKPLSDLDPPVGRLAQNLYETATGNKTEGLAAPIAGSRGVEFLLGKLPTSRYINTANNMLDQRDSIGEKAMAGLTGIKVKNVEPWMRERTSLTRATDVLREYGGRTLEMPYMPEWAKNRLSEGELRDVEALQAFMKDVQKTGRQRKKDAEALAASLENAED